MKWTAFVWKELGCNFAGPENPEIHGPPPAQLMNNDVASLVLHHEFFRRRDRFFHHAFRKLTKLLVDRSLAQPKRTPVLRKTIVNRVRLSAIFIRPVRPLPLQDRLAAMQTMLYV